LMLRHEAGDEVIDFALPACDRHAGIVGEGKANVKGIMPLLCRRVLFVPGQDAA
jgi:hypothetical protein